MAESPLDALSLLVVPRPLLPDEASSTTAPLMLVGPDRCSVYVRTSPTATTGQRFRFVTPRTTLLPPNEPTLPFLMPGMRGLASEVLAGRTASLMLLGGAGSGKQSLLLGVGESGEGALHLAVATLLQATPQLQLSWRALAGGATVDLLATPGSHTGATTAVQLPLSSAAQVQQISQRARDAAARHGGSTLQLICLTCRPARAGRSGGSPPDAQHRPSGRLWMVVAQSDEAAAAAAPAVPMPALTLPSAQTVAIDALRAAARPAAAHERARALLLDEAAELLRRSAALCVCYAVSPAADGIGATLGCMRGAARVADALRAHAEAAASGGGGGGGGLGTGRVTRQGMGGLPCVLRVAPTMVLDNALLLPVQFEAVCMPPPPAALKSGSQVPGGEMHPRKPVSELGTAAAGASVPLATADVQVRAYPSAPSPCFLTTDKTFPSAGTLSHWRFFSSLVLHTPSQQRFFILAVFGIRDSASGLEYCLLGRNSYGIEPVGE